MGQSHKTGRGLAVVTGASSGIGAATARRLAQEGYHVIAAARRRDRLATLAEEIVAAGGLATAVETDITDDTAVETLAAAVAEFGTPLTAVINNAGGALGLEPVEAANLAAWQRMYDVNVVGTARVTKALLPRLEASGSGAIVAIGSTAGLGVYEGGAGYTSAKHAERAVVDTLRLELCGRPVRVIEVDPGMVRTEEFSLNRFDGDAARAEAVYQGVPDPLRAQDIADAVEWCVTRPQHVNIDRMVIRPLAQASNFKVHRV
jgi:NADP-dependent 3-hydroxy acid dehydrogenase YdfG